MTNEGGPPTRPLWVNELLAPVAALLPTLAAGSFVLSAAFDIGYVVRLGLNPGVVPTTLSDHTRSALLWLPFVAVAALYYGLAFWLDVRVLSFSKWLLSAPRPLSAAIVVLTPFLFAVPLIFIALSDDTPSVFFLLPIPMSFLVVLEIWCLLFLYPVLLRQYLRSRKTACPQPMQTVERLFAISGCVVLVPLLGYFVALADTQVHILQEHPWMMEFTVRAFVKSEEPERVFKLLRSFEKGVLVQDIDTAQIHFFQWSEVLSLQYPTRSVAADPTRHE